MRKLQLLVLLISFFTLQSCNNTDKSSEETNKQTYTPESESSEAYPDDTYSADIEYYNPDTETRSSYTLNVEVENNEVTVIQWSNGGWLDSSDFNSEELDSSGSCSITTFDGKQYEIQITGSESSNTDESRVSRDSDEDREAVTCPECGGEKYNYDDICDDCQRNQKQKEEEAEEEESIKSQEEY